MNELTAQLHRLHTTPLGAERVRRNLQIEAEDVAAWCRVTPRWPCLAAIPGIAFAK